MCALYGKGKPVTASLSLIAETILGVQVELHAKGFTPEQIDAAVKRSRQWASRFADKVSPAIREQVFVDLFKDNISGAEEWLKRYQEGMSARASR